MTMLFTSENEKLLFERLDRIEKLVMRFLENKSEIDLKEISLEAAARILNKGTRTIKEYVEKGWLDARMEVKKTPKRGRKERLFFRMSDIREFQERTKFNRVKKTENKAAPEDFIPDTAEMTLKKLKADAKNQGLKIKHKK